MVVWVRRAGEERDGEQCLMGEGFPFGALEVDERGGCTTLEVY